MAAMNRARFRKSIQEGLNAQFGLEYRRHPEEWRYGFNTNASRKAYEEDVLLVGLGPAQVKPEGGSVAFDFGQEGWIARYQHETIALAFALTEEAREDNLYGSLGSKYARALARSMQHTKEVRGANIYNRGFDTNYAGGDGEPLFSTSHPLADGGTLANRPTTPSDLSETSVEAGLITISQWEDDRGIPVLIRALRLLIPPALTFEATRILQSPGRPGTANNDINAMRAQGRIPNGAEVNHRFTDPNAWFLFTDCPDGMKHMRRVGLSRGMEGDFESGNARYKARERYSFGWTDPRGAYGNPGGS